MPRTAPPRIRTATNNPIYSKLTDAPEGVPISAIVFGGRRAELAPLVFEAKDWRHGVFVGASVASETTAAMVGDVGVVRRDPMAMKPFCGYNFGDYWAHWLSFPERTDKLPKIFHVNWFRQDENGKFIWPGFGENLRVLRWIIDRVEGRAHARETPIGLLPNAEDIDTSELDIDETTMRKLTTINPVTWSEEMEAIGEYFETFGDRTPRALLDEQQRIKAELDAIDWPR
jgi:phosphoenolpyruvate carboxykinase (GTP)